MSGFLHRLAAFAMGSRDSTLHSLMRPPYAMVPSPIPNDEADRQAATLATKASKRHPTANSGAELDHVPSQNRPRDSLSATGFTKPDLEITHPSRPSSLKSTQRQPEKNVKQTVVGESPVWDDVIKTRSPLISSETNPVVNNETYSTPADNATPPPLLPLKNTTHSSALNSGTVAQHGEYSGSMWQSQVEETTEVHVSIGRIEVTAVHETSPQKRRAPGTAKPMTLDEYLARRRREA